MAVDVHSVHSNQVVRVLKLSLKTVSEQYKDESYGQCLLCVFVSSINV